jgi:hypothetical protein
MRQLGQHPGSLSEAAGNGRSMHTARFDWGFHGNCTELLLAMNDSASTVLVVEPGAMESLNTANSFVPLPCHPSGISGVIELLCALAPPDSLRRHD